MSSTKGMNDITIIYLTLNKLPEEWMKFQQETLLKAIGDTKIISVSRNPIDLGTNILQTEEPSANNVYAQMLRVCKMTDTKYIGIAEDDTLYVREHFEYRPKEDVFAYNLCHWSIFTWGKPTYSWRNRRVNYSLIAQRYSIIEALEERFEKYPDGTPAKHTGEIGRNMLERNLGLTQRQAIDFYTAHPIININHEFGLDDTATRHTKRLGNLRAYDIPHWGRADKLIKKFA